MSLTLEPKQTVQKVKIAKLVKYYNILIKTQVTVGTAKNYLYLRASKGLCRNHKASFKHKEKTNQIKLSN